MRVHGFSALLLSSTFLIGSGALHAQRKGATLVLRNGKIVTVDRRFGTVEAIAVRGDRIVAVGTDAEIRTWVGDKTRVLDLKGRVAIPGFIEGHGHFTGIGQAKQILDLRKVRSWSEVVEMVAAAAKEARPGEWIRGRGWHQEKWKAAPEGAVHGFPTHDSLSAVSRDNPVSLTHASGHACFFNRKAMELAGVDRSTRAPAGGEIVKDDSGRPIGVFTETAQRLVSRVQMSSEIRRTPAQVEADLRRALRLADEECLSKGVTSFQDAGSSFRTIDVMRDMVERGEIGTRLWVMIRERNAKLARDLSKYRVVGAGRDHLTVRAIKLTIDGALGSRGAWLLAPYADAPESTGLATVSVDYAAETARLAVQHDYQFCVHAIGDRANREVLDLFEKVFRSNPGMRDPRWRIEHAQHIDPEDIPRFGKLGVIASMQGIHCTSDAPWVYKRLGAERAEQGAYVWQKLMKSGALVTNGTDAPVEDVDPIASYYATVTRKLRDGTAFFPDQRMTRMQALESYTINAAKAAFEEDVKGTLVPGKLADLVVLSENILEVPDDQIRNARVLTTIVGGVIRYSTAGK